MLDLLIEFFITGYGTQCQMAIAPLILAAIGAGTGLLKNKEEQEEARRERAYQAETARWSPWTGLRAQYVKDPNMTGNVAGGAATGLSFGAMNPGMFGGGGGEKKKKSSLYQDRGEYYGPYSGDDAETNWSTYLKLSKGY